MRKLPGWACCILAASVAHARTAPEAPHRTGDEVYTSTLITRWGQQVTPDNVWQSYPRPQMKRNVWQNLNGLWHYAITKAATPLPTHMDGEILVPFPVEFEALPRSPQSPPR